MEDARQYRRDRCRGCGQILGPAGEIHACKVAAPQEIYPRCECHSCTQARRPQEPVIFVRAEFAEAIKAAVDAERERCFVAASWNILPQGPPPEVKSLPDFLAAYRYAGAQIRAKIRSGE